MFYHQDEPDELDELDELEQDEQEQDGYSGIGKVFDVLVAAFVAPLTELIGLINGWLHGDFWGTRDAWFFIPLCEEWPGGAILGVLCDYDIDVYEIGATFEHHQVVVDRNDYWRVIEAFDANGVPYQAEDIGR